MNIKNTQKGNYINNNLIIIAMATIKPTTPKPTLTLIPTPTSYDKLLMIRHIGDTGLPVTGYGNTFPDIDGFLTVNNGFIGIEYCACFYKLSSFNSYNIYQGVTSYPSPMVVLSQKCHHRWLFFHKNVIVNGCSFTKIGQNTGTAGSS